MRYLSLDEIIALHGRVIDGSGGSPGIRDLGGLESAAVQPQMTFDGSELYPGIEDKAAALCFSLVLNHPFVDGNKRIGHAAMETFLVLNGWEIDADVDEAEQTILTLAAGQMERNRFMIWVKDHIVRRGG